MNNCGCVIPVSFVNHVIMQIIFSLSFSYVLVFFLFVFFFFFAFIRIHRPAKSARHLLHNTKSHPFLQMVSCEIKKIYI